MTVENKEIKASKGNRQKNTALELIISSIKLALFFGLFLGIFIHCYVWKHQGYDHAAARINNIYKEQIYNLNIRNEIYSGYAKNAVNNTKKLFFSFFGKVKNKSNDFQISIPKELKPNKKETSKIEQIKTFFSNLLHILIGEGKILFIKIISIFASIFFYIFALLFGALNGAISRYIRTAEGGRESSFVFHRIAEVFSKTAALILFIYIVLPITLGLNIEMLLFLLLATSFYCFSYVSMANLKKFL